MTAGSTEILLVEDNLDSVELTEIALERYALGTRLVVARDGAEAIDLLFGEHARPFLFVLLDLKIPKVSGQEILKRIRADERTKLLPVVVLTSSNQEQDLAEAYAHGANSYVRKTNSAMSFLTAIGHLGRYWALLNEVPEHAHPPPTPLSPRA